MKFTIWLPNFGIITTVARFLGKIIPGFKYLPRILQKTIALLLIISTLITGGGVIYLFGPWPKGVEAVWFDDNFAYRQTVAVTNSGSTVTNFQLQIILDTQTLISAGKMQSDCDDIRIVDGQGKTYRHWLDHGSFACNTTTTDVWTKITSIPAGGMTLYVYYGNPTAVNTENASQVFELFDDFNGSSLDTSKWTQRNGGTPTFASGEMTVSANASDPEKIIATAASQANNYVLRARFKVTAGTNTDERAGLSVKTTDSAAPQGYNYLLHDFTNLDERSFLNDAVAWYVNLSSWAKNTYYTEDIYHDGTNIKGRFDDGSWQTQAVSGRTGYLALNIGSFDATTVWDYAAIYQISSSISAGSPATEEKAPAPVGYWKFDDGTGTNANDSTPNNNDGTLTLGPTWQAEDQCISGKCIFFDGSDDYVGVTSDSILPSGSNDRTISFWVRPTSITIGDRMFSYGAWTAGNAFDIDWHTGSTSTAGVLGIIGHTNNYGSTGTVPIDRWTYVTVVLTGGTAKIYFNGALDSSQAVSLNTTLAGAFRIGGALVNRTATNFKGFMDEPKIYNYARSAAQVQADYNARANSKGASAVLGSNTQNQPAALSNGLVGYWKMDETSWTIDCTTTSVTDSSGNGNNGKSCPTTTGPAGGAAGKFGNAGSFDGSNDYVDIGSIAASTNGSVAMWINRTAGTQDSNVDNNCVGTWFGRQRNGVSSNLMFCFDDNTNYRAKFYLGGSFGGNGITGTTTIPAGSWSHVAAIWEGTTVRLYVNGVLENTITNATADTGGATVTIGAAIAGWAGYFTGKMDDVRLYNRALSSADVATLYNWAPGPVGYWQLEEGSGTTANDISGNANTGTITAGSGGYTTGKYGKAYNFDNASTSINAGSGSSLDNISATAGMSVEAWIYPKSVGENSAGFIVAKNVGTTPSAGWIFQISGTNALTFTVDGSTDLVRTTSNNAITLNTWNHVSVSWDDVITTASSVHIYVNGVEASYATTTNGASIVSDATSSLYIGNDSTSARTFDGYIDNIQVYNYARTASQIVEDMNARHPAPGSPVGSAVGYWKFDEGADGTCTGGTNDACNSGSGGSALDGAKTNMASTWNMSGKFGKTLTFDGSNDYVEVSDNSSTNLQGAFTLSAWIYPSALPSGCGAFARGGIFGKGGWDVLVGYELLHAYNGDLEFNIRQGGNLGGATVTNPFSLNNWYHIVAVNQGDSGNAYVYINGLLKATGTGYNPSSSSSRALNIGRRDPGNNYACSFNGRIDEPKVYNSALTAEQVKLEYNRSSSQVLGALSDNSSYQLNAHNQEYCVPGDTTSCAAPVGEWKFEEGTGTTANDTSGNNNTGTLTLGPTWATGKIGKAVNFDGSNDYVDAGSASSLDPSVTDRISVGAWVNFASLSGNQAIAGRWGSGGVVAYLLYKVSDNTIIFDVNNNSLTRATSATTVTTNRWYYIVGVSDTTSVRLYIDGVLAATSTNGVSAINQPTHSFKIGYESSAPAPLNGRIDQVRVYDYTRTAAQIAWDYNKGAPVAWWKMDECQGTTANDSSGNSNSGTITPGSGGQTSVGTCAGSAGTLWKDGVTGKRNYSLDFDGTDDFIQVVDSTTLSPTNRLSIAAWVNPTSIASSGEGSTILAKGADPTRWTDYGITLLNNKLRGWLTTAANSPTTFDSVQSIPTSTWTHVVFAWDGSNVTLYINGKLDGPATAYSSTIQDSAIDLRIGKWRDTFDFFTGQIDDVRVYNYGLTATQAKAIYNDGALRYGPVTGAP